MDRLPSLDTALYVFIMFVLFFFLLTYGTKRFRLVHGQQALIVERLGVPQPRALRQGLNFIAPLCSVRAVISLQQKQVEHNSQVKTSDDAFVLISWVLRYSVQPSDEAMIAYVYKVEKPEQQIVWCVENELRQIISGMTLNELYAQKDLIAKKILSDQAQKASETGLMIDDVVLEQPMPPAEVQAAMNSKLAALAQQEAAKAQAEGERIKRVGIARAEAESKKLQGEGIANQRKAIAEGFNEAMVLMKQGMPDASMTELTNRLMQTNQNDMVTTAASMGKSTVIFVPLAMMGNMGQLAAMLPHEGSITGVTGPGLRDVAA